MVKARNLKFGARPVTPNECGDKVAHILDAQSGFILCYNATSVLKIGTQDEVGQ